MKGQEVGQRGQSPKVGHEKVNQGQLLEGQTADLSQRNLGRSEV